MDYKQEYERMIDEYSVKNEELLRQIECISCMKVCTSPISVCPNGHNVCGCCAKKGTDACPFCAAAPIYLNPVAEYLMANVLRYCPNNILGCGVKHTSAELPAHLSVCDYRYQCKIEMVSGDQVTRCEWMGMKRDLVQHCKEKHPDDFVDGHVMNMLCVLSDTNDLYRPALMACYDELFWVIAFYSDNFVNFYARFVGSDDRAKLFKCEFRFSSEEGLCEATCRSAVLTLDENSVLNSKSIQLNEYMVQRFSNNKRLRAQATILQV